MHKAMLMPKASDWPGKFPGVIRHAGTGAVRAVRGLGGTGKPVGIAAATDFDGGPPALSCSAAGALTLGRSCTPLTVGTT
jgi:hypothetical protein